MIKKTNKQNTKDIDLHKKILDLHTKSLEVSNHEMGVIKEQILEINGELVKINIKIEPIGDKIVLINVIQEEAKRKLDKLEARTWQILATIITGFLGTLITVAIALYFKK